MHVRFIGAMPPKGYSGGRLLALTFAESLVKIGITVDFVTNAIPEMMDEFTQPFPIYTSDLNDISGYLNKNVDIVVIVPGMSNFHYHAEFLRHSLECEAKIALLNFESPDWFNSLSPVKRKESLWNGWRLVAAYADLILSISVEGNRWAQGYYTNTSDNCLFRSCYTAINSDLADKGTYKEKSDKRILMLTRLDTHKGYNTFEPLLDDVFSGYELQVCIGIGRMDLDEQKKWEAKLSDFGVKLKVTGPVVGIDKFNLIQSSSVLYFPTRFEGFGIPPLEAGYCGTPVACTDLPVLREFGDDAFYYSIPGDTESMKNALLNAINSKRISDDNMEKFRNIGLLENCGQRLAKIFKELL